MPNMLVDAVLNELVVLTYHESRRVGSPQCAGGQKDYGESRDDEKQPEDGRRGELEFRIPSPGELPHAHHCGQRHDEDPRQEKKEEILPYGISLDGVHHERPPPSNLGEITGTRSSLW